MAKKESINAVTKKENGNESGAQAPSNLPDAQTPPSSTGDANPKDEPLPPTDEIISTEKEVMGVCVVIPYLKKAAQGDELKYALRSIGKNFPSATKVIIIGDAESWFSEQLIHIAHSVSSNNPQVDTQTKLMELVSSDLVPDDFIFSNDDIYFVSPVELHDIQLLKTNGVIKADDTLYGKNKARTIALLKDIGLKARNFDTHTPFYFNKEKLVETFEKFPAAQAEGVLLYSLYMNMHYPNHVAVDIDNITDSWLLRVINKDTPKSKFQELITNKKFLNNSENGFNEVLQNYLQSNFGKKSIFEK